MDRLYTQELKEIAQLLAILVKRGTLQSTTIQEMGSVGMSPKRIAELLGTSANTVNVALHHARKGKKKKHEN
jgi:DNA-directed RNA polymerase specialized sigma24 family protein